MSSNSAAKYLVSTISDNPREIFEHLPIFESKGFGGLHFDLMDGIFVPRLGLHPELLSEIRKNTNLFIEVHIMIQKPSQFLNLIVDSGANRVIFHLETEEDLKGLIKLAKNLEVEIGLAINPLTPATRLAHFLDEIDSVLLMAINPGIPKHPFLESTFPKLKETKSLIDKINPKVEIVIDGGVTFSNHKELLMSGADKLICGSGTVFHYKNSLEKNLDFLL
jgi:ribulose-phosphate 3-epimerase